MITIYKYVLEPISVVYLPSDAETLSVGAQGGKIVLWVKLDDEAPKTPRQFVTFATGEDLGSTGFLDLRFIGTSFLGSLIFHTFEVE